METNNPTIEIGKIIYKGMEYPSRTVDVDGFSYQVSTNTLLDLLLDDIGHSGYEALDLLENINDFVADEEMNVLTDEQIIERFGW